MKVGFCRIGYGFLDMSHRESQDHDHPLNSSSKCLLLRLLKDPEIRLSSKLCMSVLIGSKTDRQFYSNEGLEVSISDNIYLSVYTIKKSYN